MAPNQDQSGQPSSQPAPGETPASETEAPAPAPGTPATPVGGLPDPALTPDPPDHDALDRHPGEPVNTGLQDPSAPHEPTQPTEGLGSRTAETNEVGEPTVQKGAETGPAPGPSPDQGGSYQP